jgi:hypothetical protein
MLHDAIMDAKDAFLSGEKVDFDAIAADYGLNPKLVERKFKESYPNGPKKLETRDAQWDAAQVEACVERMCRKYNVPRAQCYEKTFLGVKYTIIGRWRTRYLGVSHKDAKPYKLSGLR